MTVFPVASPSVEPRQPAPVLEYRMYLFEGGAFNVEFILAPTLNFVPGRGLRSAISFDDQPAQVVDALENNSQKDWAQAVSDGVRKVSVTLSTGEPGYHKLKFRMVDPGVILEKLVVSYGPLPSSYLAPPRVITALQWLRVDTRFQRFGKMNNNLAQIMDAAQA